MVVIPVRICRDCQRDKEVACARDADAVCVHCGVQLCAHHILPHLTQQHFVSAEWRGFLKEKGGRESGSKNKKAQAFLHEKLHRKRGKFESCSKSELIKIFLQSGADLAGKVPKEILEVK